MKVLTVKEYHTRQEKKYREAIKNWKPNTGGFPCRAIYFFLDEKGFDRQDGFVAIDDRRAVLRPTEIGVKRVYNKMIKRGY